MPEFDVVRLPLLFEGGMGAVVRSFERRHGRLPTAIVVNHKGVENMRQILEGLGYDIPVRGTGGALDGEAWLQTNDTTKEEAADA